MTVDNDPVFVKHDQAKVAGWRLVPWSSIEVVVKVLQYGARKYAPDNWQRCDDPARYDDAAMRHMTAYLSGERNDPETGLHHLAHAVCCLLFRIWFDVREDT